MKTAEMLLGLLPKEGDYRIVASVEKETMFDISPDSVNQSYVLVALYKGQEKVASGCSCLSDGGFHKDALEDASRNLIVSLVKVGTDVLSQQNEKVSFEDKASNPPELLDQLDKEPERGTITFFEKTEDDIINHGTFTRIHGSNHDERVALAKAFRVPDSWTHCRLNDHWQGDDGFGHYQEEVIDQSKYWLRVSKEGVITGYENYIKDNAHSQKLSEILGDIDTFEKLKKRLSQK